VVVGLLAELGGEVQELIGEDGDTRADVGALVAEQVPADHVDQAGQTAFEPIETAVHVG